MWLRRIGVKLRWPLQVRSNDEADAVSEAAVRAVDVLRRRAKRESAMTPESLQIPVLEAIQKPLVLTFYGVLIYEMSIWDKTSVISPELGDFLLGREKTNN
jgi:hypothetical protein